MKLFQDNSSYPKNRAQQNLTGITHYADDDTLKFFKAKIIDCVVSSCGKYCLIVESLPYGGFDAPRKKRGKVFNILGRVIAETEAQTMRNKSSAILSELYAQIDALDAGYWCDIEQTITAQYNRDLAFIQREKEGA
jgi:hypothetical protein